MTWTIFKGIFWSKLKKSWKQKVLNSQDNEKMWSKPLKNKKILCKVNNDRIFGHEIKASILEGFLVLLNWLFWGSSTQIPNKNMEAFSYECLAYF